MARAKQHNHWKLMAMRRTIETRFSELCAFFDVEQTLARGFTGLQLRMEQIVLTYNLRLTSTTSKNLYLTINKTLNE